MKFRIRNSEFRDVGGNEELRMKNEDMGVLGWGEEIRNSEFRDVGGEGIF